jgi:hypothetical protein
METVILYMLLLGCKPPGRNTEQHDVFFGAGNSLKELVPGIIACWPDAPKIHIDAWRKVTEVDGYLISLVPKQESFAEKKNRQLFFLNLGGYKENEFEEFHYKMLVVAKDKGEAVLRAKETAFYKHTGFKGANSHIDDKYGVDVDDVYEIEDILPEAIKEKYFVHIQPASGIAKDAWHLGYFKLDALPG